MNKMEFFAEVRKLNPTGIIVISDSEYRDLEFVYTWHPSIDAVNGKKQIAYIFNEFGMQLIRDMLPTAVALEEAEQELQSARIAYETARENYEQMCNTLYAR